MIIRKWGNLSPETRSDLGAGLMFLLLGSFAAIYGLVNYRMGSIDRMGPGYFPVIVGTVVALMGVVVTVMAARNSKPIANDVVASEDSNGLVELAIISASVVVFAILLNTLGLFAAIIGMIVVARFTRMGNWKEVTGLAIALCAIAYVIFVIGLGMPFKLVPW